MNCYGYQRVLSSRTLAVLRFGWRCRGTLAGARVVLGIVAALTGCSAIEPVAPADAPITDPTQLYMGLTLNHPAVNLSTVDGYNTLQLEATPRDALGNPMPDLPAPAFRLADLHDTASVRVTADGMVTAVGTGTGVRVIAALTVGPVSYADTALVDVQAVSPPPKLGTLSIDPVPPDSAIRPVTMSATGSVLVGWVFPFVGISGGFTVVPQAVDTAGATISGLTFEYRSLDPTVATVDRRSGVVTPLAVGRARLVGRTIVYGVAKADTMILTLTMPITADFRTATVSWTTPAPDWSAFDISGSGLIGGHEVQVRSHGMVVWTNILAADEVDVTFDDPTNVAAPPISVCTNFFLLIFNMICGTGNFLVPPTPAGGVSHGVVVQFPVPGVYPFRSTRTGATGRVVVTAPIGE